MSWEPDAQAFLTDLEEKPSTLRSLADALEGSDLWGALPRDVDQIVLIGMGSSRYAASVAASRLRARDIHAVAEYASARAIMPGGPGVLAIGISAGGETAETVETLRRHRVAGSATVALTNAPGSALAGIADRTVELEAGDERGGVACRTFQHTLALLLALEGWVGGAPTRRAADLVRRAADATSALLDTRDRWLPDVTEVLTGTDRAFLLAPVERACSAEQGALMLREGPRLHADACESGDWLHVDVYLTKPLDYRALLFAGSRFDPDVVRWITDRDARLVAVGADTDGAALTIRYPGDDDPDVALLTEVLVPELVAAAVWLAQ